VLERLERIEALDRAHASGADLLAELRALLREAEDWTRAEREVPQETIDAIGRCRELLFG